MTKSKLIGALVTSTLFWVAPSGAFAATIDTYNIPNVNLSTNGTIDGSLSGSLTVDWTTHVVTALSIATTGGGFPAETYSSGNVTGLGVESSSNNGTAGLEIFFNSAFVLISIEEIQSIPRDTGILDIAPVPLPAALPLFATGIGALGLLGWRKKRKARAAA